ncbi:MAG TPA: CRISPR system precrRNA processing endoribonuclease RAMP protein Cas6 [Ktedonobacteraceae bacterium]|nr:CRISPR system precrRNA processing endoribonuclease RAMP protein Cas6 [Ktedonobacteraceae bacterium]
MSGLETHHLLFVAETTTPLELDDHSGSALRGSLFDAVWKRFCTNRAAATCFDCPLHDLCPVSALVAPLREENVRGRDVPRPYIILPPLGEARRYEKGKELLFGLTLFGNIVQLLPYILLSVPLIERFGLGKRVGERGNQRGLFKVKRIESYHPLSKQRQTIYTAEKPLVGVPALVVTPEEVKTKAATLPTDTITLRFLTPTRITERAHPIRKAAFRPLIWRLLERFNALQHEYGGGSDEECIVSDQRRYIDLADTVRCVEDGTHWEEVYSYSYRQKSSSPIGGLIGQATFAGDLTPFRELLTWGELMHVGKNCVKGNGWYTIEA